MSSLPQLTASSSGVLSAPSAASTAAASSAKRLTTSISANVLFEAPGPSLGTARNGESRAGTAMTSVHVNGQKAVDARTRVRRSGIHLVENRPRTERPRTESSSDQPSCQQRQVRGWMVGGAIGLGAAGMAAFAATSAQAAPVEFPDWATVTGTIPDDAGLDREAADRNNWTFSWSTDVNGVVNFVYADGTTSSSAAPPENAADTTGTEVSTQSGPSALWTSPQADDEAATAPQEDGGMNDLAAAVSAPFGGEPTAHEPASDTAQQETAPQGTAPPQGTDASDQAILDTAHQGLGGTYIWGGTDYMAWDCSGFVQWVYAQNGIEIPRVTWDQFAAATPTENPRPGDLVSQNNGSHVGIYLGGDQMISALNPQEGTIIHSVHAMPLDGYYTFR